MRNKRMRTCIGYLKEHAGIFYGMTSGISRASGTLIVKDLTERLSSGQILFIRSLFQSIITVFFCLALGKSLKPAVGDGHMIIARSITHALTMACTYFSLSSITYYKSIVIIFGTMSTTSILISRCCLSEEITFYKLSNALLIFSGIMLVFQPNFSMNFTGKELTTLFGFLGAFMAGILASVSGAFNRHIKETPSLVVVFYCSISNLILGLLLCIPNFQNIFHVSLEDTGKLLIISVLSMLIVGCLSRGLQLANLLEVSLSLQIDVPFGLLLQVVIFHKIPNGLEIFGSFLVVLGVILVALEKLLMVKINKCLGRDVNQ